MTKSDRLKGPEGGFDDDLNMDLPELDFGNESNKSRKPADAIKKGIKSAVKNHVTSEQTLRRLVNKTLPKEYGAVFDTYTDSRDNIKDAVQSVKDTMREPVNEFAKAVSDKVPASFKRTRKFLDYVKENTESYKPSKFNQAKEDDRAITASLEQMFAAQDEARQYERSQEEAKRNVEKTEELIRFKGHTAALNIIARSTDLMAKNTIGITQNYQRKSLELQYRTVFGIRDTNEQLRVLIAQNRAQLDQIRHNTGLPETQKLQLSERYTNTIKNKFVDNTLGKFTKGDNVFSAMTRQFSDSLKEVAQNVAMGLQMAATGMSMDFNLDDEDPVQRRRRMIAEGITGWGLNKATDLAGGKLKKVMRGNRKVNRAVDRGRSHIKNFLENGDAELREFALGGDYDESAGKRLMRDLAAMLVPNRDTNRKLTTNNGAEFLRQPAVFDGAVKRSITEVMPGYLARILQELQITRTGNAKVALTHFDADKGVFVSKNDLLAKYSKEFNGGEKAAKHLDKFIQDVSSRSGVELGDDVQDRLRQTLLRTRLAGGSMTPGRMTERGFWSNTGSKQDAELLAKAFSSYFDSPEAGKFSQTNKGLSARNRFLDAISSAQESFVDPRAAVQNAYTQGHGDVLREMGWIKDTTKGDVEIDFDKIVQAALGKTSTDAKPDTVAGYQNKRLGKGPRFAAGAPTAGANENWAELTRMLGANTAAISSLAQRSQQTTPSDHRPVTDRLDKLVGLGELSLQVLQQLAISGVAGVNDAHTPDMPGAAGGGNKFRDLFKNWRSKFTSGIKRVSPTEQEPEARKARGFWDRTIKENLSVFREGFQHRFGQAKHLAGKAFQMGTHAADKAAEFTGETLGKTRLFGARLYEDFKDGIPAVGDVFVGGERIPRLRADGFKMGEYFDGKGNPVLTLIALSEVVDGVFDKAGQLIMSRKELEKSYVKSNGKIFARVFLDRVMRASKRIRQGAGELFGIANVVRQRFQATAGVGLRFAKSFVKELLMPPRDVYVTGESTPRLLAHVMRLGGYLNMDGSVIERPTLIKGPVMDTAGEILISQADLVKGLVDSEGKPFRTIVQRLASGVRARAEQSAKFARAVVKTARNAGASIARNAKTFFQKGMSGFRDGGSSATTSVVGDSSYGVTLLEQIRDILDARLPGEGGFTPRAAAARSDDGSNTNGNNPTPGEPPQPNRDYDGGQNVFSLAGKMATKGFGAITGAFRRWRNKRKGLPAAAGALAGAGGDDTSDVKEAVKDGQEKTAKEIDALKKENKSLFKRMRGAFTGAKKRMVAAAPAVGASGKPVKGDTDGDGLRDNSWQDLKNKQHNINEPTKDLSDVPRPADMGTENTIDMLINMLTGKAGAIGSALGGAADLLGDWGGGKKGGKVPPTGKKGIFRRAGGKILDVGKRAGGALGRAVGGTAARIGGKAAIGRGLMTAGSFALKRLAIPALGGIAAILGAPWIGTALAVGGAVWGLKELYDLAIGDKKKNPEPYNKGNATLRAFRMAEYGVSTEDTGPQGILSWLEDYLYPSVVVTDGKAAIDEKKINADDIVTRFGLDLDNEIQMARFSKWLEGRFKPNFLKHAAAAKTANLASLKDTDKLKPSQELAFFRAVSSTSEGHDELSNPFGTADDLKIGPDNIREMKGIISQMLEEKAKKEAPEEKKAEMLSKGDLVRKDTKAILDSAKLQGEKGAAAGNAAMDRAIDGMSESNKLRGYKDDKSKDLASLMGGGITYATPKVQPLPSKTLSPLASIRFRLYGLMEIQPSKSACLNALEAQAQKFIVVKKDGSASFNGSIDQVFESVRSLFGISTNDSPACQDWKNWFEKRFLPVFTTYYAQVCYHTGATALDTAVAALTPAQTEAVANSMVALAGQVMSVMTPPWPKYTMSSTTIEIKPFLQLLHERSESQTLQEEKIKPAPTTGSTPKPVPNMLQAVYRPDSRDTSVVNPRPAVMPNVLPDVEKDQTSGGGGGSAPAKAGGDAKSSPPGVGSLKKAPGELFGGGGADAFLKFYKGATLDGANPEALKLFRGMVEEYGNITGKSIQLNSGFRSFSEQAEAYKRDPQSAARPGGSLHEFGLAFDINSSDADALEKLGLMRKYGFTRPVGGEPWHIEPAGIQENIAKYKRDGQAAMMAVSYSPGKGGGGVGITKDAYPKGRRNTDHALALLAAGDSTAPTEDTRTGAGNRSASVPTLTNRTGYAGTAAQVGQEVAATQGLPDYEGSAKNKSGASFMQRSSDAAQPTGTGGGYADLQGSGNSREDIKKLVADAAKQVGVDPHIAQTTVAVESGFRTTAAAGTSSAKGLYQFTNATWQDMVQKHGAKYGIPADAKPTDPKANALMGALYVKQNMQRVSNAGLPQNALNAYLMHFLGPGGGKRFLGLGPDVVPAHAMPDAAEANKAIFFDGGRPRSKQEIMDLLQRKLSKAATDFGIQSPGGETVVADASKPAANDASSKGTDTSVPPAPSMQSALYKPSADAPRPVQTRTPAMDAGMAAPSLLPQNVQRQVARDVQDPQVGSMGTQQKALVDSIMKSGDVLEKQLDIQTKILQLLTQRLEGSEKSSEPTAQEGPPADAKTVLQPDRRPRTVSEPVIDTRRRVA